jgi:hypothetical protein
MKNMTKNLLKTLLKTLFIIFLSISAVGAASAQIISGMEAARVNNISTGGSTVENRTRQSIHFYMSCDGESWEKVNLAADKAAEFSCSGYSAGPISSGT